MDPQVQTALLVLAGTAIGALAGVLGNIVTAKISNDAETKRQLVNLAFECASKEQDTQVRTTPQSVRAQVYPLALFIHHHAELLKLIREGQLTAESYAEVSRQRDELMRAIEDSQQ